MSANIVILSDRIKELSHTKGAGPFVLDGKINGFSPFGDFYEYGDVVYYAATDGTYYEVGSGEYRQSGSDNQLTRFPLRSSALDSGPYYLNGQSASGPTRGKEGYYYPMFLTRSAALAVAGATTAHTHTFSGYHGVTFYMPNNHQGHAEASAASATGVDYVASGQPFDFPDHGIKEVYVTYPGKYSVYTGYGISGFKEPSSSGIAFWGSEQLLNYDENFLWSNSGSRLGLTQTDPQFALDIGGNIGYSQIRSSGFFGGGSGVFFSGGQPLPQDATKTASGGRQLEPFFRNELDNQTGTDAIFYLSGVVNQRLCHLTQEKGTFFAGPASGCETAGCSPDYPTFRYLELEDVPDLKSLYVIQDLQMIDIDPATLTPGTVALYKESGVITYKKPFAFVDGKLGVGTNAPKQLLDVLGNAAASGDVVVSGDLIVGENALFSSGVIASGRLTVQDHALFASGVRVSGNLLVDKDAYFGNDVTVSGDLFVKGTTTYIDSTNVTIHDKQLELSSLSGNAIHDDMDSLINDGGILVRSSGNGTYDTGDKKWTWQNSNNTWTAQTSNSEKLGVTASGMIFNDGTAISGTYKAGSGLTLLEGDRKFAIGNMFKIGAIDSGNAGEDGVYVTDHIHQADEVGFSGVKGVAVYSSGRLGQANQHLRITVDPSDLSGVLQHGINGINASAFTIGDLPDGSHGGSTDTVSSAHTIFWSGGDGIGLKYIPFTDSGIFEIDYSGVIGGGSAYSWNVIASGEDAGYGRNQVTSVPNGTGVALSGVSGIRFTLESDTTNDVRVLIADPSVLSGVLENAIDTVSGLTISSGDFLLNKILNSGDFLLNEIRTNSASGVGDSGIIVTDKTHANLVDYSVQTTAANSRTTTAARTYAVQVDSSDKLVVNVPWTNEAGGDTYAGWKVATSSLPAGDLVEENNKVYISGISGIQVDYTANYLATNDVNIVINANPLSGILQREVDASGDALRTIINASGAAVSGWASQTIGISGDRLHTLINGSGAIVSGWASGTIGYLSAYTDPTVSGALLEVSGQANYRIAQVDINAGSGLRKQLDGSVTNIHMDVFDSGQIRHLGFLSGVVRMGNQAEPAGGSDPDIYNLAHGNLASISIGNDAGNMVSGYRSVSIGEDAHSSATGVQNSIAIGYNAGKITEHASGAINIGHSAGSQTSHTKHAINIGYSSRGPIHSNHTTSLGYQVGYSVSGVHDSNLIGKEAGSLMDSGNRINVIGYSGGHQSYCLSDVNSIGTLSTEQASGLRNVNAFGHESAKGASELAHVDALGFRSASGMLNSEKTVAIGSSAGLHASGIASGVFIGDQAGFKSSGNQIASIYIGHSAGANSHHMPRSVGIGASALNVASGDKLIALGNQAGMASSGCDEGVSIGDQSSKNGNNLRKAIMIGRLAGAEASGTISGPTDTASFDIFIGEQAGYRSLSDGANTAIGYAANWKSYQNTSSIFIGGSAGFFSNQSTKSISIGHLAGSEAYGQVDSIYLGDRAGASSSGDYISVKLGTKAGFASSGCYYNTIVGYEAGMYRNRFQRTAIDLDDIPNMIGNHFNIILGYNAGSNAGGSFNTLIGDWAGYEQDLERAIIITHNSSKSTTQANTSWINTAVGAKDNNTVVLGNNLFAIDEFTQLGKTPTSASDFNTAMLTVHKTTNTKVGIKTKMFSTSDTADQIQATTDSTGSKTNTIVNSHGFLQLPVAASKTGSNSSGPNMIHFFMADGSPVPEKKGVVVIWNHYFYYFTGTQWKRQTAAMINF